MSTKMGNECGNHYTGYSPTQWKKWGIDNSINHIILSLQNMSLFKMLRRWPSYIQVWLYCGLCILFPTWQKCTGVTFKFLTGKERKD